MKGTTLTLKDKTPSRTEKKAQRPHEILDAAFEAFRTHGYAATRMDDIAALLNITKGTIYLYFPTKDALFEAMLRHISVPFSDLRADIERLDGSCSDRLRRLLELAYERIAHDNKISETLRMSLTEADRFPQMVDRHYIEFIEPLISCVDTILKDGISQGEFCQPESDDMPHVIVSSVLFIVVMTLLMGEKTPFSKESFIAAHIELVLRGLKQPPQ